MITMTVTNDNVIGNVDDVGDWIQLISSAELIHLN